MNRRDFLRGLFFGVAAIVAAPAVLRRATEEVSGATKPRRPTEEWDADYSRLGYKDTQFLETGVVYAPYIPLYMSDGIRYTTPQPLTLNDIRRQQIPSEFANRFATGGFDPGLYRQAVIVG